MKISTLKTLATTSFILSAIFTIMLMTSNTIGFFPTLLMAGMAILFEMAKFYLVYTAITDETHKMSMRIVMGIISALLIVASILASAGFIQNQSNQVKNFAIENSEEYKNQQEARKVTQDLYAQKKKELDDLITLRDKQIKDNEKIRDSYARNYITVKQNLQAEIDKKASEMQGKINAKSSELSELAKKLEQPLQTVKEVNTTKGYSAMFKLVCNQLNKYQTTKSDPYQPNQIEFVFFVILSIIFEITAVLFMYNYQHEMSKNEDCKDKQIADGQNKAKIRLIKDTETIKNIKPLSMQQIGFKVPEKTKMETSINQEDLRKYVEYMKQTARIKDGYRISKGYQYIANQIGISFDEARKIKSYLEKTNVIEVLGRRTILKA